MSDIFNFLNQENEEEPQNIRFDSLEALQNLRPKDPLANIRTYKTAREISNEIAMSTPFGRRSKFYSPEYINKNIDFVKLSELISNQKDVVFNWKHYIGTTTKTVKKTISHGIDAKFDRMAGIPTSYTETITVKSENPLKENTVSGERVLNLNAKLNTEIGIVNIHIDNSYDLTSKIEFNFDYKNRKVAYKLHYYYDGKKRVKEKDNKGEIAFTISSPKYDDFDAFLKHSKIKIAPKRLETFQNDITSAFKEAITEMDDYIHYDRRSFIDYKYGNLQWIYENIPYFVGQHLDFEDTFKIVLELSSWDKGSAIIDTTKSILKALRILNPLTVYDHFNKNPQKIIELFNGFHDDSAVEQFCTFLTAIVLAIKGKSFSEDKARVFELSEDKHIETNILYGDDKGKVELVNERDRPIQFIAPKYSTGFFVYPRDEEINNPNNASNKFHPFDIVFLSYYDEMLQAHVKIPTIAIYAKYLGDKGEWEDVLTATFAVIDVISIILSGGALAAGVRGIARIFAIIDITVSTINLAILIPAVKQALSKTEAGKWFVTHWPIISFCVSAGMLSHYLAKGILKYGKAVKGQLKNNPKLGKQIDELIEESEKITSNFKIDNFIKRGVKNGRIIGKINNRTIIQELTNTVNGKQVGQALKKKEIKLFKLDEAEFRVKAKETAKANENVDDVLAFQYKENIYVLKDASLDKAFSEIVHEGKHAIDYSNGLFEGSASAVLRKETGAITHDGISMKNYVNKMTDDQVIELRARIAEREFQIEAKYEKLDFSSVSDMISFIFKQY